MTVCKYLQNGIKRTKMHGLLCRAKRHILIIIDERHRGFKPSWSSTVRKTNMPSLGELRGLAGYLSHNSHHPLNLGRYAEKRCILQTLHLIL